MSKAYIIGASAIGAQPVFDRTSPEGIAEHAQHPLEAMMPDMSRYVPALKARRMTRLVRLGVMAGLNAMERAAVKSPGAIIVGTGDGCKHSTERFLTNMIDNDEQVPDPTAFIGSTHNSAAGQIALAVGSTGYNYTYLHRGLSFPSALADGLLHLSEGNHNVLVGGMDVITPGFLTTQRQSGLWKRTATSGKALFNSGDRGALAGEGAGFFVLDSEPHGAESVELLAMTTGISRGASFNELIGTVLGQAAIDPAGIDLVVTGRNGDTEDDQAYEAVDALFPLADIAAYKHLTGEYYTANAMGAWYAWSAVANGGLPEANMLRKGRSGTVRTALLIDHFQRTEGFALLLRKAP